LDDDRLPKRLLHWRPELDGGKRRRRRILRGLDVVKRDAATTGAGRDIEEAAEMGRRSGAGCSNYRSRQRH
jgi:hypothetical protein